MACSWPTTASTGPSPSPRTRVSRHCMRNFANSKAPTLKWCKHHLATNRQNEAPLFAHDQIFQQVGRLLGGEAGHLAVRHQGSARRPQFFYVFGREHDFLVLCVAQNDVLGIAPYEQTSHGAAIGGVSDIRGVLWLDAPRRLENALQQIVSSPQPADVRQVRPDRRTSLADLVATAAVHALRPEQFFSATSVSRQGQNRPWPGVRAELPRSRFA